jgi:small-conductance mechanosensitive channel
MMMELLQQSYWGNTVQDYIIAGSIFIVCIVVILLFKRILLQRLKVWAASTHGTIDDFLISGMERSLLPLLYVGAFYAAISNLTLMAKLSKTVNIVVSIAVTFFVVRVITATLRFLLTGYLSKKKNGEEKGKQITGIMLILSAVIWILGMLFLLDNWGVDVTALVAGLGIGGIAIALAAQTILGDLFSYFVIFFDRPFEIGDFIIVQDKLGTVEYIGIKTTRLRSLSGEQLVFSNTDLTNSRVHNYKRMERRRIVFSFTVPYHTSREKLAAIPGMVREVIEQQADRAKFDRIHFSGIGPSNYAFEGVYIVLTGDYNKYMDVQQDVLLGICAAFEKNGISFGNPAQTLHLQDKIKVVQAN